MNTPSLILSLAVLLALAACGAEDETADESSSAESSSAETTEAETTGARPAAEAPPEPAPAPAAPAAAGDTTTVTALRDAFTADQSAWVGREVTVTGLFFSATSMSGTLNNISMLGSRDDDMMSTVICGFGDNPPASVDLSQYDEVTVRGTVRERFRRPALDDCSIVE